MSTSDPDDSIDRDIEELARLLSEAGLLELDEHDGPQILGRAMDAPADEAAVALLLAAGRPPFFALNYHSRNDLVDKVNSELADEPVAFSVVSCTRQKLVIRAIAAGRAPADDDDEDDDEDDEDDDSWSFVAHYILDDVPTRMNQVLADAGAHKRIYQFGAPGDGTGSGELKEVYAFAVLKPEVAARLQHAGIKLH